MTANRTVFSYFFLFICSGLCISFSSAVRVKTVSEAKAELLARQERAAAEHESDFGPGIFGNHTYTLVLPDCFRLETTGVGITVQERTKALKGLDAEITHNTTKMQISGSCTPINLNATGNATGQAEVTIDFSPEKDTNVSKASIKMLFTRDRFIWILTNLSLSASYADSVNKTDVVLTDVPLNTKELFASAGASYYCTNQEPFRAFYGTSQVSLLFRDLIMEPFGNDTNSFSPVESCEYAFSMGIWMAVVTGLIMAIILGFGISMLASIRNMDRFDDPKTSKLLSVPSE